VHRMLEQAAAGAVVDSAASWWQASPVVHRGAADILLVSSELPAPGEELVERLRRGPAKIVLLMHSADPDRLQRMLRLPVSAVLRDADLSVPSLRHVLDALGQELVALPRSVAQQLLRSDSQQQSVLPWGAQPALTQRELDTLTFMVEGLSNRQIARRMGISEHGAKRHVANVRAKLNSHNRTMAVTTAIRLGLVEAGPR
jgi:two-component system, NarL family, nitrate/nitrite response regulator NarL